MTLKFVKTVHKLIFFKLETDSDNGATTDLSLLDSQESDKESENCYDFEECGELQKLPDEVLNDILGLLDRQSKLHFSITCKRFSRIFNENLKNFEFTLDFDTNVIPEPERAYSNVVFKNLSKASTSERLQSMRNVFKTMGPQLKIVKFHRCTLSDYMVITVLRQCPLVASLSFTLCRITNSPHDRVLILPQLKELVLKHSSVSKITRIIQNVYTLEKVVIGCCRVMRLSTHIEPDVAERVAELKAILSRQSNLKELHLTDAAFFKTPFNNVQLDKLVIKTSILSRQQSANISDFILSQTRLKDVMIDTEMVLERGGMVESLDHVLKLTTLQKLEVEFYDDFDYNKFYIDLRHVNPSVVDLTLSVKAMEHSYKRFIETTASMFPNLRALELELSEDWLERENTSTRTLEPLNNLKKLKLLNLHRSSTRLIRNLKLQNLKILELPMLSEFCFNDWKNFLENNLLIERICVHFFEGCDEKETIRLVECAIMELHHLVTIEVCLNSHGISDESFAYLVAFGKVHGSPTLKRLRVCTDIHSF